MRSTLPKYCKYSFVHTNMIPTSLAHIYANILTPNRYRIFYRYSINNNLFRALLISGHETVLGSCPLHPDTYATYIGISVGTTLLPITPPSHFIVPLSATIPWAIMITSRLTYTIHPKWIHLWHAPNIPECIGKCEMRLLPQWAVYRTRLMLLPRPPSYENSQQHCC